MIFRIDKPFIFSVLLVFQLWSCSDCDPIVDTMKCKNNKLYICSAEGAHVWEEFMNCNDFDSACQKAERFFRDKTGLPEFSPSKFTYGCAVPEIECTDGDTDLYCAKDHSYIAACFVEPQPAAIIIDLNNADLPFCTEKSDGTADFAYAEGECQRGESTCMNIRNVSPCRNGVWGESSSICLAEHNLVCAVTQPQNEETSTNQDTESSLNIDTDTTPTVDTPETTLRKASCVNADPCEAETGEYQICAPEYSSRDYFTCRFYDGHWFWDLSLCNASAICKTEPDGTGKCIY